MESEAEWFFEKPSQWQDSYLALRTIIINCQLAEYLKWGCPCYGINNKNIVLIHGFKDYCAILFMKGALINDTYNLLIQQSKNVQSARQMRFTKIEEIFEQEPIIKQYILEAIEIEKSGIKVALKPTAAYEIPEEFNATLNNFPEIKAAFEALTPGRQRAYLLHFSAPKQSKTRVSRIESAIPKILIGKGLNDLES